MTRVLNFCSINKLSVKMKKKPYFMLITPRTKFKFTLGVVAVPARGSTWTNVLVIPFLQLHPRFTLERNEASSDFHKFQLFSVQAKSQCLLYSFNRMTEISIFRSPYKSYFGFGIDERQVEALYGYPPLGQILAFPVMYLERRWSCTWNAFKYQCSLTGFGVNL